MIGYARISKMLAYEQAAVWPLNVTPLDPMAKSVFRRGTRGWEYPWVLEQLAELPEGSRILDCGCGESGFPVELYRRKFRPSGLDFFVGDTPERLGYGITNKTIQAWQGKVEFINGGMADIPADDATYDAVTSISVMEHIVIQYRHDPQYHLTCLDEMKRVLKPGGLLICTYDTILNPRVVYAGTPEWSEQGWYYLSDIDYLNMRLKEPRARRVTRDEIMLDEDAFFVPPDLYFQHKYGTGFELFGAYHRLTSVGFVLVKD